jgi:hypothetical protein
MLRARIFELTRTIWKFPARRVSDHCLARKQPTQQSVQRRVSQRSSNAFQLTLGVQTPEVIDLTELSQRNAEAEHAHR